MLKKCCLCPVLMRFSKAIKKWKLPTYFHNFQLKIKSRFLSEMLLALLLFLLLLLLVVATESAFLFQHLPKSQQANSDNNSNNKNSSNNNEISLSICVEKQKPWDTNLPDPIDVVDGRSRTVAVAVPVAMAVKVKLPDLIFNCSLTVSKAKMAAKPCGSQCTLW